MQYPNLNEIPSQKLWTEQFTGLDRRPRTYDGSFDAMGNVTGEPWPLLSSRGKRGVVAEAEAPLDMAALGKLCWIDGSTLYYNGAATPITSLSTAQDMLPKRLVTMGAYIIVFPDGAYYNTADNTDYGTINRLWSSSGNVSYSLCTMDGIDYPSGSVTVSNTAPANPSQGDYWINTAAEPHAMYQYNDLYEEWVGISSVYVKISAANIGNGVKAGDGVTISGISYTGSNQTLKKQLESLNETSVVQAAGTNYIVIIGLIDAGYTQTGGTVRADRKIPKLDHVIECNNRLWGCRYGTEGTEFVNRIYASALGDFKNWRKYNGTSMDSYFVNVGTDGPFTGAVNHRGYPYFFKEDCVHRIFGETPSNFQTQTTLCDGVQKGSEKTLIPYNGALYYLGRHGVQRFESLPENIGKPLGEGKLSGGAAGECGGVYYLSAQEEDGQYSLYTFNLERQQWHRQDDSHAIAFAALDGEMYMLKAGGQVIALNGKAGTLEAGNIVWFAETAPMGYEYPEHKYLSRFVIRIRLGEHATCQIKAQYDGDGIWHDKGTLHGKNKVRTYTVPIVPRRCDFMKVRLEGRGDMRLYGLARELTIGSDGR